MTAGRKVADGIFVILAALVAVVGGSRPAIAAHKRRTAHASSGAPPDAATLESYIAPFHWGMSWADVEAVVDQQIRDSFTDKVSAQPDVYHQDLMRTQMQGEVDKFNKSYVEFTGTATQWDTSIVSPEFGAKNNEAMAVHWETDQRKFFFFVDGKLWKIYIAFNAEKFPDKTFDDFRKVLEGKFGSTGEQPVTHTDSHGKATLDEYDWPAAGRYTLRGVDQTGFYGNFCLAIEDTSVARTIKARRLAANPPPPPQESIVDSVLRKPDSPATPAPPSPPAAKPAPDNPDTSGMSPDGL